MKPYYIDFDTQTVPGKLKAVRIDIGEELIEDLQKQLHIDLVAHPLYAKLESYVLANPSAPGAPVVKH